MTCGAPQNKSAPPGLEEGGKSRGKREMSGTSGAIGGAAQIELGGLTAGAQHDQLDIAGTANLDGPLQLAPLAAYTDPATHGTADDFTIITAGDRSGTFSTVQYDGSTLAPDVKTDDGGGCSRAVRPAAAGDRLPVYYTG